MQNEEKGRPSIKSEMTAIAGAAFEALQVVNGTAAPSAMNSHVENEGLDPRRMKRTISNRASAQKSRMKKLQYVVDMETKVKALEARIAMLSPQVAMYQNQKEQLQMENKSLTQQISAIASTKKLKDEEIEKNKAEVNRLRQLHLKQCRDQYLKTQQSMKLADKNGNHEIVDKIGKASEGGSQPEVTAMQGRRAVEYKWMPTPGLRLTAKPSSAGSPETMVNLDSDAE